MSTSSLTGSCLCSAVHYTAKGEAKRFVHCHCKRCRKASGTGHTSNLFLKGDLTWECGEEFVKTYKLPEAKRFSNTFCSECGGRLPRFVAEFGTVFIPAGSLDVNPDIVPQARIFSGSRADWSCDETNLPVFDEYPS